MNRFWFLGIISLLIQFHYSCISDNKEQNKKEMDIQKLKEQFISANRHNLQKERDIIEQYIRNHNQPYKYTPQGIYFYLIKPNEKADSIRSGQTIKVEYKIYLLDGTLCYQSESGKPHTVIVEKDQTESGIHRGLLLMRMGERARLIIPSYLAHGLLSNFVFIYKITE